MKHYSLLIVAGLLLALFVALPIAALAQTPAPNPATPAKTLNISNKLSAVGQAGGYGTTPIAITIGLVISTFLSLLGIIFLVYTVYAGYLWLTSSGNDEKIDKAKSIIRGSIIGIIIVLSAYAITRFVVNRLEQATGYNVGQTQQQTEESTNPNTGT